jgi:glycosyltransferase involved in cell wall biosynthesis
MTVDILLASFNGAMYLPAQLESIAAQTYRDWRLIVRDDGSSDGTAAVVESFAIRFPGRVHLICNTANVSRGATANFSALIDLADADYVLFADQDDEWLPTKIEQLMAEMRLQEARNPGRPILVHSDLLVTDEDLVTTAPSFWVHMELNPHDGAVFNRLLVENCVTGCASLINRHLLELARPIPSAAIMHDWWLALVASAFGAIGVVEAPTVRYRQHANNAIGANAATLSALTGSGIRRGWHTIRSSLVLKRAQASSLIDRYGDTLDPACRSIANEFIALPRLPIGLRQWRAISAGLRMSTAVRTIGLYLSL